jgi:ATP-binding cassette subfamily B protein
VLAFDGGKVAGFLAWEMPTLVNGVVLPLATVVAIGWFEPVLAVPAALIVVIAGPVLRFGLRRVEQVYDDRRRLQGDASERMLEYVRGIDVIRAHDLAGERQARFREALYGIRDADIASVERLTPAYSAFQALIDAGYAVVLVGVAWLVSGDNPDNGDLIAALILTTTLFRPQLDMGARALHLPELAASLARIESWLASPTLTEPEAPAAPPNGAGVEVRLDRVAAGYEPGAPVVHDIDLVAPAGSVTAIVGPSGAGKSTVLRVIAGLVPLESGSMTFNGVSLDAMTRQDSAALVSAVMQDVGVLQGTIFDAIAAGDPSIDRATVEHAARAARIHDRIMALEHRYDTELGEDGSGLSGGERQRIAIARAICKRAPVVLLDEATSALDPTSERLLREALANLTTDRTVIVVAHRLETIRHADHIVFVAYGRIVEEGTHDELHAAGGRYAGFWATRERAAGWTLQRH